MQPKQIHFVTGKLAEKALRQTVEQISNELEFIATIQVMPITVAALMTPEWIAKRLEVPEGTSQVVVPGYCDDVRPISQKFEVEVVAGPKDLRHLCEFLGGSSGQPAGYGSYDIEIIAEINHAPRLSVDEVIAAAKQLSIEGADIIDFGCIPGYTFHKIDHYVAALKNEGHRVSVDSLNPAEIELAANAGAELVLSVNSTNCKRASDWGIEVVVIPDQPDQLDSLDKTIGELEKNRVPFRIDPILEPIGCGFAKSLQRYWQMRNDYPNAEIMMGIGNLTELTDVDSAGINVLLLGICQELGIRSVLTTEVINWARTSVKECDLARRLVHYSVTNQVPAKRLDENLVMLRDPRLDPFTDEFFADLAEQIKDHNFRIFADGQQIHLLGGKEHIHDNDPFEIFDQLLDKGFTNLDPSHSFYLGFEMCKAMLANQLGKEYQQDQALRWGYLTVDEQDRHRLKKRKRNID